MRFIVVANTQKQRLALCEVVFALGFELVDSLTSEEVLNAPKPLSAEVWLVDVDDFDEDLENIINQTEPEHVIVGFNPVPLVSSVRYERWQRTVIKKVADILELSLLRLPSPKEEASDWRYVVFLGASMGGVEAVKEFLDNLSPELPIAVLIAQHYDEEMIEGLPKIITRHNNWRCRLIQSTQSLQAGMCLLAPVDKQIVCDSTGRVLLSSRPWGDGYRPNIGKILKNTSEVFGNQMIGVILSGMGDDGSQYAKQLPVNQSRLWAQDPTTCQSPSQPKAFIDTGVCQFVASPSELAKKLGQIVGEIPLGRDEK